MDYTSKIISLEKALSLVKSDDTIVTGLGASEGGLFMENIHTLAGSVRDVKIVNCNPTHSCEFYKPEYTDAFSVDGWFYAPAMRARTNRATWRSSPITSTSPPPSGSTATGRIST